MHKHLLLAALCYSPFVSASANDSVVSLTTGIDYSSGKYGQSKKTDTLYVPLTLKYEASSWVVRLTVPYVETTGPTGVIGQGADRVTISTNGNSRSKASGLGDIVFSGTQTVFHKAGFLLDIGAKVKLATGDETVGLSTGKNDYSLFAEIYQTVSAHTLFSTVGYRKMGDPSGVNFNDPFYCTLGWSVRSSPSVSTGLTYDYRQRLLNSGTPAKEATVFLSWKLDSDWKLQTYAIAGFSRSSPDWGGGLMLSLSY